MTLQRNNRSLYYSVAHLVRSAETLEKLEAWRESEECRQIDEDYRLLHQPKCPECEDAGFVAVRRGPGRYEYPPCTCRFSEDGKRRAMARYSGLPTDRIPTFDGWRVLVPEQSLVLQAAQQFAEGQTAPLFTFTGGIGTGKTHLLQAIGWICLDAGIVVKYVGVPRLLDDLRKTFGDESTATFAEIYEPMDSAEILLLDDLGAERATPWAVEQLYKIINHRYEHSLRTACSTNLDYSDMRDQLHARIADRIFDGYSGRSQVIEMHWGSYRTGGQHG